MDPKTLEALHGSIAKWQAIVDGTGTNKGAKNCPLCRMFNCTESDNDCDGCPVFEKSGYRYCEDTPYDIYSMSPNMENAQAELDFLKSLVPEEGRGR